MEIRQIQGFLRFDQTLLRSDQTLQRFTKISHGFNLGRMEVTAPSPPGSGRVLAHPLGLWICGRRQQQRWGDLNVCYKVAAVAIWTIDNITIKDQYLLRIRDSTTLFFFCTIRARDTLCFHCLPGLGGFIFLSGRTTLPIRFTLEEEIALSCSFFSASRVSGKFSMFMCSMNCATHTRRSYLMHTPARLSWRPKWQWLLRWRWWWWDGGTSICRDHNFMLFEAKLRPGQTASRQNFVVSASGCARPLSLCDMWETTVSFPCAKTAFPALAWRSWCSLWVFFWGVLHSFDDVLYSN